MIVKSAICLVRLFEYVFSIGYVPHIIRFFPLFAGHKRHESLQTYNKQPTVLQRAEMSSVLLHQKEGTSSHDPAKDLVKSPEFVDVIAKAIQKSNQELAAKSSTPKFKFKPTSTTITSGTLANAAKVRVLDHIQDEFTQSEEPAHDENKQISNCSKYCN